MLLRIRAKALQGDQETIRALIKLFGSPAMEERLVSRSQPSKIRR